MKLFTVFIICVLCYETATGKASKKARNAGKSDGEEHVAPYLVSIRNAFDFHICNGAIVGDQWILTASHCLFMAKTVRVGSTYLLDGGEIFKVKKTYESNGRGFNNLGLLKVKHPIAFNETKQSIKLHSDLVGAGEEMKVAGWGIERRSKVLGTALQEFNVTSISSNKCERKMGVNPMFATDYLCIVRHKGKGICWGDIGSPVVLNGELVGVICGFLNNCSARSTDTAVRISLHYKWIEGKMGSSKETKKKDSKADSKADSKNDSKEVATEVSAEVSTEVSAEAPAEDATEAPTDVSTEAPAE